MTGLLLRDVVVGDRRVDVRCAGGVVTEVGPGLAPAGARVVTGAVTALPGLHDHHLHLLAMAARGASVELGGVADPGPPLREADRSLPPGTWLRAVGYRPDRHGELDRWALDRWVADRPVRVQHRSGHQWVLNSAAIAAVRLGDVALGPLPDGDGDGAGIERGADGVPTGRLVDLDGWLAERLPEPGPLDLAPVSRRLASLGVTGVTDATPSTGAEGVATLAGAVRSGAVAQQLVVLGGAGLAPDDAPPGLTLGPVKVMVTDGAYPSLDGLAALFAAAHDRGRSVAVHCISRTAAVLALAAWARAGAHPGDRMEHGSVLPLDAVAALADLGVTVVTQPGFVADRGDVYLDEVDPADRPHLYRCASLERAGVPVGGSTDAPFGPDDPWTAMRAAVDRRAPDGRVVGPDEAVTPERALGLFLSHPERPGGPTRTVAPGAPADLCLLDCGLEAALGDLDGGHVVATVVAGTPVYER